MSFSEALEKYLRARDLMGRATTRREADKYHEEMVEAADHLDALTESTHLKG